MTQISEMFLKILAVERYRRICALLRDISFEYAIIKGEALSLQAYLATGRRVSSDIDILIPVTRLKEFHSLLSSHGFRVRDLSRSDRVLLVSGSHQVLPYTLEMPKPWPELILDINHDIFWGEYEGKRIDIGEFLSDTIEMDIYGVKVKTLTPLKTMIQLVLHHYKDMNSIFLLATSKSIKYDMFKDVYYLLKNNLDTISIDKLYQMSSEYEIIPYVFYVLYYTGQIFDDDVLNGYIEAFRTPEGEALLECYGLCAKEQKKWNCDFKTRLEADNLYELIKSDLTVRDLEKIVINKRIFMGVTE